MNYDERVAWIRMRLRRIIARRLYEITGDVEAQMHYKTYWLHIVRKYGILVDHWPVELMPFGDPSTVTGSLVRLELLWIRWKRRATGFRHATAAEMDAFKVAGLFAKPARKRRSDYDVVRGRRRDSATRSKKLKDKVVKTPAVVPDGADDSDWEGFVWVDWEHTHSDNMRS